ncbi:hypothetical protein QUA35_14740 [Microcoleus sp. N9_B2]
MKARSTHLNHHSKIITVVVTCYAIDRPNLHQIFIYGDWFFI